MQRKLLKILLAMGLFSILSIFIPVSGAQSGTDNPYYLADCFENARGQLLSNSNSQTIAHAGIILGLIVALGTGGANLVRALKSNKFRYWFLGILLFATIIFLLSYETGRLFYWSGISAVLTFTNSESVLASTSTIVVPSNASLYMSLINNYAIDTSLNGPAFTNSIANNLYPDTDRLWNYAIIILLLVVPFTVVRGFWGNRNGEKYSLRAFFCG